MFGEGERSGAPAERLRRLNDRAVNGCAVNDRAVNDRAVNDRAVNDREPGPGFAGSRFLRAGGSGQECGQVSRYS